MKILVVAFRDIKNPESAGASIYLHKILSQLAHKGHDITILSSGFRGNSREESIGPLKVFRIGSSLTYFLRLPFSYLKRFRGKFDIVIEEFSSGWFPFFASLYISDPLVVLAYQRQREVFFKEMPLPIALLCSWLEGAFVLLYKLIGKRFIAISEGTRDDLVSMGIPFSNIAICRPGQGKIYDFQRNNDDKKEDAFVILSRARPYKGINFAIDAMKFVVEELPQSKLYLILGKAHNGYENRLRRQISDLKLSKNVLLFFNCNEKVKKDILSKSKILLNPSLKEGFGMVVIEANALGLPAIAFNVSGSRDVIFNGLNGYLVPSEDFRAMSKRMIELLSNKELYRRLSCGAQKWSKNFDWETTVAKFETFLCSSLANKKEDES